MKAEKLFKDFLFILQGCKKLTEKTKLPFCNKENTKRLIRKIKDIIEDFERFPRVGTCTRLSCYTPKERKKEIINMVDNCISELWAFYRSMDEYITEENITWDAEECKED